MWPCDSAEGCKSQFKAFRLYCTQVSWRGQNVIVFSINFSACPMEVIYIHDKSKIFQMWWKLMVFHHRFIFSACSFRSTVYKSSTVASEVWGEGMHIRSFTISRHSLKNHHHLCTSTKADGGCINAGQLVRAITTWFPFCILTVSVSNAIPLHWSKLGNQTWCAYNRQGSSGWMEASVGLRRVVCCYSAMHTLAHTHTLRRSTQCYLSQLGALME